MQTLTLIGAGGKMGCRITKNVKHSDWKVHYVEVNYAGIQRLKDCGVSCTDASAALPEPSKICASSPT
jgi:6-phosphogluconate dehydrogenase (decarboxylating)